MLRVKAGDVQAKREELGCGVFEAYRVVKRETMLNEIDQLYRCIHTWGVDRESGLRILRLIEMLLEQGPRG